MFDITTTIKNKIINFGKSFIFNSPFSFSIKDIKATNGNIQIVLPTFKVVAISPASSLYKKPEPTTDAVSWIANAENKPNCISVKPKNLPIIGNKAKAIAFIKKIIKTASDIWFGLALMMDDIANAAVAPQIAFAEVIRYINFLSKLNNLPINKPKRKVITTKILIIGK